MNCPDCNVALDERKHRGIEIDHCPQCRGLWLDFDEMDILEDTANRDEILKGQREYARRPGERPCPHCGAAMDMFNYRAHNLPIDHCPNNHGYWLDKGEEDRVPRPDEATRPGPPTLRVRRATVGPLHGARGQPWRLPRPHQRPLPLAMKIVSPHGNEISSLEDWSKVHKPRHWKKGNSAYSIAEFILERDGIGYLESRLSEVLRRQVVISLINPEKEIRFDLYGKGRVHDLGINCVVDEQDSLFVGLEAKVEEPFAGVIQKELAEAERTLVKTPGSNMARRIKELPARYSSGLSLDSMLDVRYQLVHGTVGTVAARQENGDPFDHYVFYVLVFKTALYDQSIRDSNHRDFQKFINRVGSTSYELPILEAHAIEVDNRQLTCIYEQIEFPAVAA